MTARELAEVAGCNERTVRRVGKELFPSNFRKGVKTIFEKDQCFDIMAKLPKRNLVQMSEAPGTNVRGVTQNAPMDYEALSVAIAASLGGLLEPLLRRMMEVAMASKAPPPTHMQIEAPLTHQTLLGYCNAHDINDADNTNVLRSHGLILRGICNQRGLSIKRVPHERYGTVNSYPIEVLEEYFSI